MQRPACRRHAHPLKGHIQPFLQPLRHLTGQLRHLVDIVDLTVQHGPLLVLRRFHVQHLEAVTLGLAHNADHTAGADVKRKNQVISLCFVFTHADAPLYSFFPSFSMALKAP